MSQNTKSAAITERDPPLSKKLTPSDEYKDDDNFEADNDENDDAEYTYSEVTRTAKTKTSKPISNDFKLENQDTEYD